MDDDPMVVTRTVMPPVEGLAERAQGLLDEIGPGGYPPLVDYCERLIACYGPGTQN